MDSSRTEVLLGAGLLIAASFVMGILGAQSMSDRIESRQAREAEAVDREFDQLQEDGADLVSRLEVIDRRLARIEAEWTALANPAEEDPM